MKQRFRKQEPRRKKGARAFSPLMETLHPEASATRHRDEMRGELHTPVIGALFIFINYCDYGFFNP
jgi:hypothetical protein